MNRLPGRPSNTQLCCSSSSISLHEKKCRHELTNDTFMLWCFGRNLFQKNWTFLSEWWSTKTNKTKTKPRCHYYVIHQRKKEKSAATFPFCIAVNTICSHIWGFGRLIKQHNQFYYHTVFWDPELSWWAFDTIFTLFTAAPKCIEYDPIIDYMLPCGNLFVSQFSNYKKKWILNLDEIHTVMLDQSLNKLASV